MVRMDDHLLEIKKAQKEVDRSKPGTPHYKDAVRHLRKLRSERAEALRYLNEAEKRKQRRADGEKRMDPKDKRCLPKGGHVSTAV